MDQTEFDYTLEHVRARAGLLDREAKSLAEIKRSAQNELDDLTDIAPGDSDQSDKEARINREIFRIEKVQANTEGRQVALIELSKKLDGATNINAIQALASDLANSAFPADTNPTNSAFVTEGYFSELNELIGRLRERARRA